MTDHVALGSLGRVIKEISDDCALARTYWNILAIPGVELTHVPPQAISEVAKKAKESAVLANVVDDADNSDFIVPSSVRRGDITIAISTAGRSPALARKIRSRLEKEFGDEYAALALLIDEVRTEVKRQHINVNGDDWQEALDLDLMIDLIKKGDGEKARHVLLDNLKARQK